LSCDLHRPVQTKIPLMRFHNRLAGRYLQVYVFAQASVVETNIVRTRNGVLS
jgi:hypothetical protein